MVNYLFLAMVQNYSEAKWPKNDRFWVERQSLALCQKLCGRINDVCQRNYGQVARESCCPKSCCPKPESCCPKFVVMSPENHGHVARNLRKKILKNANGFKNQIRVYIHSHKRIYY